jgi:hypothetical protein
MLPGHCAIAARLRALTRLSLAESCRAEARTRSARSSGGSFPSGSTSRSRRANIAERAASAWSARAMGRDQRAFAAILARSRRCSGVTRGPLCLVTNWRSCGVASA